MTLNFCEKCESVYFCKREHHFEHWSEKHVEETQRKIDEKAIRDAKEKALENSVDPDNDPLFAE